MGKVSFPPGVETKCSVVSVCPQTLLEGRTGCDKAWVEEQDPLSSSGSLSRCQNGNKATVIPPCHLSVSINENPTVPAPNLNHLSTLAIYPYTNPFIYLPTHQSIYPCTHHPSSHSHTQPFTHSSIHSSVHPSTPHSFICSYIYPSTQPSTHPPIHPSIHPFTPIYPFTSHPCICPPIYPSAHPVIHLKHNVCRANKD